MNSNPPAGWYPDPEQGPYQRYWNGNFWTDQVNRKYEYFVWHEPDGWLNQKIDLKHSAADLQDAINKLSSEGWELFEIGTRSVGGGSNRMLVVFRRPKFD